MKRLLYSLFIFSFSLLCTPSVFGQKCSDYPCVIANVRKAMSAKNYRLAFEQLESAEGYPSKNIIQITELRKQLFNAVEKEKEGAIKANDEFKKQTERAENAEREAKSQNLLAQQEKKRAENALAEVDSSRKKIVETLESLGKLSDKEYYLSQYNHFKEKADSFTLIKNWDSTYFYYKQALYAVDSSPYIKIDKKLIYNQIELYSKKTEILNNIRHEIYIADSLTKIGKFENFSKAFSVFYNITKDTNYNGNIKKNIIDLSNKLEWCLKNMDSSCINIKNPYSTMYLLLEINYYLNIKNEITLKLQEDMNKEFKRIAPLIEKDYSDNKVQIIFGKLLNRNYNEKSIISHLTGDVFLAPYDFSKKFNPNYIYKSGFGARLGWMLSNLELKDSPKKIFTKFELEVSAVNGYSSLIRTLYFKRQNGTFVEMPNVKLENDIRIEKHSLISSIDFPFKNSKKTKKIGFENSFFSAGLGFGLTYNIEKYSDTRRNFLKDSTLISGLAINYLYETKQILPKEKSNFFSIFYEGDVKFFLRMKNYDIGESKRLYLGFRIHSDCYLFLNKNQELYRELKDKFGIIGGNRTTIIELAFGFAY